MSDGMPPEEDAPPGASATDKKAAPWAKSPHMWVSTTYFAEGFPYAVVNQLADVLFTEMGASLKAIGLTSLFHLPWNLKFLWSPFLDAFATKRGWMVRIEIVISLVLLAFAATTFSGSVLAAASVLFVAMAFLSATHDIAIDGYYLEGLDKDGQSQFVGYRATAYKLAMMLVAGPLLILIAKVGPWLGLEGDAARRLGWSVGFLACAGVMALITLYHVFLLPRVEKARRSFKDLLALLLRPRILVGGVLLFSLILGLKGLSETETAAGWLEGFQRSFPTLARLSLAEWIALGFFGLNLVALASLSRIKRWLAQRESFYADAFIDFLSQRHVGRILAFVIIFRAGESFLLKMRYPFMKELGMTQAEYGFAGGTVGLVASFTATMVGGYLISKKGGLQRWIWPFMLAQNVLNLLFVFTAWYHDQLAGTGAQVGLPLLTTVITLEAFGSGLGTALFMVYIMRCCRPAYKAAHMAILTAFMSLSFTLAGVASGFLAQALGFTWYFLLTFGASLPAMLMVFFIPYMDGTSAADAASPAK